RSPPHSVPRTRRWARPDEATRAPGGRCRVAPRARGAPVLERPGRARASGRSPRRRPRARAGTAPGATSWSLPEALALRTGERGAVGEHESLDGSRTARTGPPLPTVRRERGREAPALALCSAVVAERRSPGLDRAAEHAPKGGVQRTYVFRAERPGGRAGVDA